MLSKLSHVASTGSHPRVREKHLTQYGNVNRVRITPASAGKTCQNDKDADCTGITPACAGKIGYNQSPNGKSRDHPRVCGKNRLAKNIARAVVGSPPRVREKLFYVNKADTITYFRKFSQRCFLRSTFFTMIRFPME